jgi:multiple sugar transport system permease protein
MFKTRKSRHRVQMVVTYAILFCYVVVVLFPLYWVLLTSVRTPRQVYSPENMLLPSKPTLDNYIKLFDGTPMPRWIMNSAIVTTVTTFASLMIAIFAAYALARLKFRGAQTMGKSVLFMYLLPSTLLYIPLFIQLNNMKVLNTRSALFLTYPTFLLPFITWLLFGYFKSLPEELEDAARIDGCSRFGVLYRIVLPLAAPAIVTAAVFGITNAWNEFLYALVFIQSDILWTLPIGIRSFQLADTMLWGITMSAAVLTTLPPIIVYMMLSKYVVGGLTGGAVKG